MKVLLALALMAAGVANAFDFYAATDGSYTCGTYCVGFTTSDGSTLSYVNLQVASVYAPTQLTVTLNVNGKTYQGRSFVPIVGAVLTNREFNSATQTWYSDGSQITVDVNFNTARVGCGRYCTRTRYFATGGSVTLP
jgi:hypothetical protein